jgi:ABC-type sugar transport system ATPase subunit
VENVVNNLEFKHISKEFPGVKALEDISFSVSGGEVLAIVGENGAGKSTLLKILNGDYQVTSGSYLLNGEELSFKSPHDAILEGVGVIYQERQLVQYLSVAENIFMGNVPVNKVKLIDFNKLNKQAQSIIDEFQIPIKASTKVKDISVAYQQMVEIMKAYQRKPRVIAFDEPTASLSDAEIDILFKIIHKLKKSGIIILYVSHRMKEIFQIADSVVILKDGKFIRKMGTDETTTDQIINLMVGRPLGDIFSKLDRNTEFGETVLEVKNLRSGIIENVSFSVRAGEIVGFSGLVGAGRTETIRAIYGADAIEEGEVLLNGEPCAFKHPIHAIQRGIAMCPEDRKDEGIVAGRSVGENLTVSILHRLKKWGMIDRKVEDAIIEESIISLNIRTPSSKKNIVELSGGNQQKVIVARCLATKPKVLILDEPTKGIDVGAKFEIFKIICSLAKEGLGIIVISSDLPEVIGLCDRILVMSRGEITGELLREEATEEKILTLAMARM